MEITKLHERCLADRELRAATRNGEWLIALHSSLSSAEQQSVFERPPEGPRSLSADAALRMPGWRRVQAWKLWPVILACPRARLPDWHARLLHNDGVTLP